MSSKAASLAVSAEDFDGQTHLSPAPFTVRWVCIVGEVISGNRHTQESDVPDRTRAA